MELTEAQNRYLAESEKFISQYGLSRLFTRDDGTAGYGSEVYLFLGDVRVKPVLWSSATAEFHVGSVINELVRELAPGCDSHAFEQLTALGNAVIEACGARKYTAEALSLMLAADNLLWWELGEARASLNQAAGIAALEVFTPWQKIDLAMKSVDLAEVKAHIKAGAPATLILSMYD